MAFFIGVDGGGSATRVLGIDDEGRSFSVRGEGSNPIAWGTEESLRRIEVLVSRVLAEAGAIPEDVRALSVGLAGVERDGVGKDLQARLEARFPKARIEMVNDALALLSAGTQGGPGIALVAGTGAIAVGEDDHGTVVRAGGFGYLVGDEGGGFALGRAALMAAEQALEGRGPGTALAERALEHFGCRDALGLIDAVYLDDTPVKRVAAFATEVLSLWTSDPVAAALLEEAASDLEGLVRSVLARLPLPQPPTVVLGGGLFLNSSEFRSAVVQRLSPIPAHVPAWGADAGAALRALASVLSDPLPVWLAALGAK